MARQIEYTPINVYSKEYNKLSIEEKFNYYNKMIKTVNQRLRALEKAKVTYAPAYVTIEKSGRKTATGNIGFRSLNPKKHSLTDLNKEIRAAYKALNMKTITITGAKEYIDNQLKRLDLNISSDSNLEDELKRFWDVFDYFTELHIFDNFIFGSQGEQEVVRDFIEDSDVKNYKNVGHNVKRILDSKTPVNIVNQYKDKDKKELKTKTDILLSLIAEKKLAIKNPEELDFKGLA